MRHTPAGPPQPPHRPDLPPAAEKERPVEAKVAKTARSSWWGKDAPPAGRADVTWWDNLVDKG